MTSAAVCAFPPCRRVTRHSSGRCHDHRDFRKSGQAPGPLPEPGLPVWEGGRGEIHPTGGYDNVTRRGFAARGSGSESYTLGDDLHRLDGPAYVRYGVGGHRLPPIREEWSIEGRRHRLDGPAVIYRSESGVVEQAYYVFDRELTRREHEQVREAVEAGAPEEWVFAYLEGERS